MNKTKAKQAPICRYDFVKKEDGHWYGPMEGKRQMTFRVVKEDGHWCLQQFKETGNVDQGWYYVKEGMKDTLRQAAALAKRLVNYKETVAGFTRQTAEDSSRWLSADKQFVATHMSDDMFTLWQHEPRGKDDESPWAMVSGHPIETLKKCRFFSDLIKESGLGAGQQAIARYNRKRTKGKDMTSETTQSTEPKKSEQSEPISTKSKQKLNKALGFQTEADIKLEISELQRQLVEMKSLSEVTISKWNKLKGLRLRYSTQVGLFYLVAEHVADNEWSVQLYTEQEEKDALCTKSGEFLEAVKKIDDHAGTGFIALFKVRKDGTVR